MRLSDHGFTVEGALHTLKHLEKSEGWKLMRVIISEGLRGIEHEMFEKEDIDVARLHRLRDKRKMLFDLLKLPETYIALLEDNTEKIDMDPYE